MGTTWLAGSLDALVGALEVASDADVVVVPTAAAATGATEAAVAVARALDGRVGRVEALMVTDRAGAAEPYFCSRVAESGLVVLTDGSALHARVTWRETPLGDALRAAGSLVALGAVATTLFDVMVDPRGGAPTTGLGFRSGLVVTVPAPPEALARTRALLGDAQTLAVIGGTGVVTSDAGRWRVSGDVVVTRGDAAVSV